MLAGLSLTSLVVTVALIIGERLKIHDEIVARNDWNERYDFIVVGAGTAGSVVAARLSEVTSASVLLLEAGNAIKIEGEMPLQSMWALNSDKDWKHLTVPQNYSSSVFYGDQVVIHEGKVVGGTSNINGMNYVRGIPQDYDRWEREHGATGWGWNDVLPHFKKAESNFDAAIRANGWHGTSGPVGVTSTLNFDRPSRAFINATVGLGFPSIQELNAPGADEGAAVPQKMLRHGRRQSSSIAYLEDEAVRQRKNLHILANSLVTRVLFDTAQKPPKAIGVEFWRNGTLQKVFVNKEVIVSAGFIKSAHLLLLSGVGPKDHLNQHQIPLVADSPVGQNFVDPYKTGGSINFAIDPIPQQTLNVSDYYKYFVDGIGGLAVSNENFLRYKSKRGDIHQFLIFYPTNPSKVPNVDLGLPGSVSGLKNAADGKPGQMRKEISDLIHKNVPANKTLLNIVSYLPIARSRGWIRLNSNDPFDPPLVNPNYCSNPEDVELLADAAEKAYEMGYALSSALGAEPVDFVLPTCGAHYKKLKVPPRNYLKCVSCAFAFGFYQPYGANRIGNDTDPEAVVDARLRIRGVQGVRVADFSVAPDGVAGFATAVAIMIGEKAADMIKADNQLQI